MASALTAIEPGLDRGHRLPGGAIGAKREVAVCGHLVERRELLAAGDLHGGVGRIRAAPGDALEAHRVRRDALHEARLGRRPPEPRPPPPPPPRAPARRPPPPPP